MLSGLCIIAVAFVVLKFLFGRSPYNGAAGMTSTLSKFGPGGMFSGMMWIIIIVVILASLF